MNSTFAPNQLINERSLYLKQHAHNPVHWFPWSDAAWQKARDQNKLVLISIGYSSCHWCHVMEHESFENAVVADLMNQHVVAIKVDREERPDIDGVYMQAVQVMTGQGGWPLNCFTLPDGRPIYGGTYFRTPDWMNIITRLAELWQTEPERMYEYASELTDGIRQADILSRNEVAAWNEQLMTIAVSRWKQRFDHIEGGMNRAPKFPMPDNYRFLLRFGLMNNDKEVLQHLDLTLKKMAEGGIYDHVGGGFYRYSTDALWKVPHFEKMLYDNAQLMSLYAEYAIATGEAWAKYVAADISTFLLREFRLQEGCFASSMDADSEGVEGKYYVWSREELTQLFNESDAEWLADTLSFNQHGWWEDHYIPLRRNNIADDSIRQRLNPLLETMSAHRSQRVPPGLDVKVITAWNAMLINGFCNLWRVSGNAEHLQAAENIAGFIQTHMLNDNNLQRIWQEGHASVLGFLDDVALTADAMLELYQCTFKEAYFNLSTSLVEMAISRFGHENDVLFYYTPNDGESLIHRQTETEDNVIPSSNAVMANVLFTLGSVLGRSEWMERAEQMLGKVSEAAEQYMSAYSKWGQLALKIQHGPSEMVITGPGAFEDAKKINQTLLPNVFVAATETVSDLPMFHNRIDNTKLQFFVCKNQTCSQPVFKIEDAIQHL